MNRMSVVLLALALCLVLLSACSSPIDVAKEVLDMHVQAAETNLSTAAQAWEFSGDLWRLLRGDPIQFDTSGMSDPFCGAHPGCG